MNLTHPACAAADTHELRFKPLFDEGRSYAFPCDAQGRVDMDSLSRMALQNYLYARAVVGRELFLPQVTPHVPERRVATAF